MATIHPYLNFPGTAEEAFRFYQSVFGSEIQALMRYRDTPQDQTIPEEDLDKIMHIALPIGEHHMLMATDTLHCLNQPLIRGNNVHLNLSTQTKEEADRLYLALSAGGQVVVPIQQMFWGDYFGMVTDAYGISWMINFSNPPAETTASAQALLQAELSR